jgi:DNA polymerase-3 subunit epsilon
LDPNAYRRRLDQALGLFTSARDGRAELLAEVDRRIRAEATEQRFERAAWLRRRRERLAVLLERLGGVLAATQARPRLVLAEHPRGGRFDVFWLVAGRVTDWGPLLGIDDVEQRTAAALRTGDWREPTTYLTPDQAADHRVVATWLATHPSPELDLVAGADRAALERFLRDAGAASQNGSSTTSPVAGPA